LSWLFSALDIITPSIYLGVQSATPNGNTSAYVESTVQEAVRLANTCTSTTQVVPVAWHHYDDYWRQPPPTPRALLTPSDLHTELVLPLKSGADALLIWGAVDTEASASDPQSLAALQAYANDALAEVVKSICEGQEFMCKVIPAQQWGAGSPQFLI